MPEFNIFDWYWLADDGRVFASARQQIVTTQDPAYVAWTKTGGIPTPWPADDSGAQTNESLQWVFDNAGVDIHIAARTLFAPRDFMALFTANEQTAMFTARRENVQIDMFITLAMAGNVDLTNADVIADVQACVTAGLLTAARAKAILAGQAPTS